MITDPIVELNCSSAGHRPGHRRDRRRQRRAAEAVGDRAGHLVAASRPAAAVRGQLMHQGRRGWRRRDHRAAGTEMGQDLLHRSGR